MRLTKSLVIIASILLSCSAFAKNKKPIIVAVIDTGISEKLMKANFLCKMGHRDLTGKGLNDTNGHGTHISGLIDQYVKNIYLTSDLMQIDKLLAKKVNYCQVIIKYYDADKLSDNMRHELVALRYAINIKVDVINFSAGGVDFSPREARLIKEALDKGIRVVVAAGNESKEIFLREEPKPKTKSQQEVETDELSKAYYFPASLDSRLIVVGNVKKDGDRGFSSNYGEYVKNVEMGTNVISLHTDKTTMVLTGTSQSTAIKTGKIIRQMLTH
jgi:subtilisin family serine protease